MQKKPIVIFCLIIVCVYSFLKQEHFLKDINSLRRNNDLLGTIEKHARPMSQSNSGVLDIPVGGYTPPSAAEDPEVQSIIQRNIDRNRPWSSQGVAQAAEAKRPEAPQRLGDVVKAGFRVNNLLVKINSWAVARFGADSDIDQAFRMRDHQDLLEDIPGDMMIQFRWATNRATAERIREDIFMSLAAEKSLIDAGIVGMGAGFLGGFLDIDILILVWASWFGGAYWIRRTHVAKDR
ncbi:hypothetical protein [Humidesulfovibrio sp.]